MVTLLFFCLVACCALLQLLDAARARPPSREHADWSDMVEELLDQAFWHGFRGPTAEFDGISNENLLKTYENLVEVMEIWVWWRLWPWRMAPMPSGEPSAAAFFCRLRWLSQGYEQGTEVFSKDRRGP